MVADHLSQLSKEVIQYEVITVEKFPDEQLVMVVQGMGGVSWYMNIVNYKVAGVLPSNDISTGGKNSLRS